MKQLKSNTQRIKELITLIHVGKSKLCLDDETYKSLLISCTTVNSTKHMSIKQLEQVFSTMKQLGFKVQRKAHDPQTGKIRSLWLEMSTTGVVKDRSDAALNKFVLRETRVNRVEWLSTDQASLVIEKLKQWNNRVLRSRGDS